MIENATRPVLSIYTTQINTGSPTLYFVVKNFGSSPAIIKRISSNHDFKDFLIGCDQIDKEELKKHDPMILLKGSILAPGQSKICALQFMKLPEQLSICVLYESPTKKEYSEIYNFDPAAGNDMIVTKSAGSSTDSKIDIKNISYTLQEMLQKNL